MIAQALTATALASGTVLAVGLFHPQASVFGPTLWRVRTDALQIALTFDDGPDPDFTPTVLKILEQHQIKATFFCIGRRLEQHKTLAKEMLSAGHALANHTYQHNTGFHLFSPKRLTEDLKKTQDLLSDLTGIRNMLYRPAVGIRNPPVHQAARELQLTVVTWTHTARDGIKPWTQARAITMAQRVAAGDIVTLHDGALNVSSSLRAQTLQHLPSFLKTTLERGFKFSTLPLLIDSSGRK